MASSVWLGEVVEWPTKQFFDLIHMHMDDENLCSLTVKKIKHDLIN